MITYTIVQLRDIQAEAYTPPQFVPSLGAYLRQIQTDVNSGEKTNPLSTHPQDFEIFELGTFTDSTGKIDLFDEKISHGLCSNYIIKRQ